MKAAWKPSTAATAAALPSATRLSVTDVATADSTAMPSAPPICCDVLKSPEASPASSAFTPASAAIEIGTNEKPSPTDISRKPGRRSSTYVPSTDTCVNQSSPAVRKTIPVTITGLTPMRTGLAYLAVAGTAIIWSTVAAQLVTRIGVKPVLVTGMTALTAGLVFFTQVSVGGSYVEDLLPGFLLIGLGLGFSFVPISIAALAGVQPSEAGLASGLINTSQQIGGALGIAILSTIATTRTSDKLAAGSALHPALVSGFTLAFMVGVGIAAVGILAGLLLIRREELQQAPAVEAEPAFDLAA